MGGETRQRYQVPNLLVTVQVTRSHARMHELTKKAYDLKVEVASRRSSIVTRWRLKKAGMHSASNDSFDDDFLIKYI